jgi:hypothetical protein
MAPPHPGKLVCAPDQPSADIILIFQREALWLP